MVLHDRPGMLDIAIPAGVGALGAHRFYLHGWRDTLAWLHPLPAAAGLLGALRMRNLGVDDGQAWVLIPLLGLMLSQAMLCAIVYGLTPDEKWDARFNPASGKLSASRWPLAIILVASMMLGAAGLIATISRLFDLLYTGGAYG